MDNGLFEAPPGDVGSARFGSDQAGVRGWWRSSQVWQSHDLFWRSRRKGGRGHQRHRVYLTRDALNQGDDYLMKVIIEENLHLYRVRLGLAQTTEVGASTASGGGRQAEEDIVSKLTDKIFEVGRERNWW